MHNTISGIYEQRDPKNSHYFQCTETHFEELEMIWGERYRSRYGAFRPHVKDVIHQYLDCGDPHNGFARIKCNDCNHEFLLPFSCKRRHFCPSCHQKRVITFGEELCENVLKAVPHRHWVFSIPKRLRIYFLFDRKLLPKLSRCVWNVLKKYLVSMTSYEDASPGAVLAMQTFGDFLDFHPHVHAIVSDGCFYGEGLFMVSPSPLAKDLEEAFRHEVLKMLKKEGKINDTVIENMMSWHHTGFNIYCGPPIWPQDEKGLENLARYIIRASFSQERMTYIPANKSDDGTAKVLYRGKDGKSSKTFDAVDWLALLVNHIPDRYAQTIKYNGFYSNRKKGDRRKAGRDNDVPALIDSGQSRSEFKKNWARLIQKIYNVDPLICPNCHGNMKVISVIEEKAVIKKILQHLNLWDIRNNSPPEKTTQYIWEWSYDDSLSQIPEYEIDYWSQ